MSQNNENIQINEILNEQTNIQTDDTIIPPQGNIEHRLVDIRKSWSTMTFTVNGHVIEAQ